MLSLLPSLRLPFFALATLVVPSLSCALDLGEPCIRESRVQFDDPRRFLAIDQGLLDEVSESLPEQLRVVRAEPSADRLRR